MKIVAFLSAHHKASCATNDPSSSRCDCGAKKIPLVTLQDASAAVANAATSAIQQEGAAKFDDVRDQADHDAIFRVGAYAPKATLETQEADEPNELESVIACLGDDAARLHESEPEVAENMRAAERLLAAVRPQEVAALDERAAFEVELRKRYGEDHFSKCETPFDGLCYLSQSMAGAWDGWQARAALASPAQPKPPADAAPVDAKSVTLYVRQMDLDDARCTTVIASKAPESNNDGWSVPLYLATPAAVQQGSERDAALIKDRKIHDGYRLVRLQQRAYETKRGAIYGGKVTENVTPLYSIVDEVSGV